MNGIFTGNITKEQFEKLAQNLRSNGFFSIVEKDSSDLILDTPPNFIKAVYAGKTKQVSDAKNDLSSMKIAILGTVEETIWVVKNR